MDKGIAGRQESDGAGFSFESFTVFKTTFSCDFYILRTGEKP
jgi:hypothetical protein